MVGGPEDFTSSNATLVYDLLGDGVPAVIVSRSSGDHTAISSDPFIMVDVAAISLSWIDLALYGTQDAYDALHTDTVCVGCEPGVWSLMGKHLETLLR